MNYDCALDSHRPGIQLTSWRILRKNPKRMKWNARTSLKESKIAPSANWYHRHELDEPPDLVFAPTEHYCQQDFEFLPDPP